MKNTFYVFLLLVLALQACEPSRSKVTYLSATFDDQPSTSREMELYGPPDGDSIIISQDAIYSFETGHPSGSGTGNYLRFPHNNNSSATGDQTIDLIAAPIPDSAAPLLIQMSMSKRFNPNDQGYNMYIQLILDNGDVMAEVVVGGANDFVELIEPTARPLFSTPLPPGPGLARHKLTILANPVEGHFFVAVDDKPFGAPVVYKSLIECTPNGQSTPALCHQLHKIRFMYKNVDASTTTFSVDDVTIESAEDSDMPTP